MPKPAKDSFTVAATPATDYPLTAIPLTSDLGSSLVLSLNGLVLVEGTDYTVDYGTAVVTVSETLVTDDKLYAEYWTTGELVAATLTADVDVWTVLVDWDATGWKNKQVALTDTTDYSSPSFDDSAWSTNQAAFGGYATSPGTSFNTAWSLDTSMWLRRSVTGADALRVTVRIDNFATVWINGTEVVSAQPGSDLPGELEFGPFLVPSGVADPTSNVIVVRADDDAASESGDRCFIDLKVEGVLP